MSANQPEKERVMTISDITSHPRFVHRLLTVDAIATGATSLLLLAAANALSPMLQLPAELLRIAGFICAPFAACVFALSRRTAVSRGALRAIVTINFAWVAASVWVAFGGAWQPSALGIAFVLAQALAVFGFAEFGWMSLRKPAFQAGAAG
jgi:hypothetical protein